MAAVEKRDEYGSLECSRFGSGLVSTSVSLAKERPIVFNIVQFHFLTRLYRPDERNISRSRNKLKREKERGKKDKKITVAVWIELKI